MGSHHCFRLWRITRYRLGVPLGIAVSIALPESFVTGISIPINTIVVVLLASIVVGIIAAIGPARRAAKLDVLEAISAI